MVLEKTLESPLDHKELQILPKSTNMYFFSKELNNNLRSEVKAMTEGEMVGWHHRLNGHGFRWTLGVGDGQGGLACCGSWGCKESDMTGFEGACGLHF